MKLSTQEIEQQRLADDTLAEVGAPSARSGLCHFGGDHGPGVVRCDAGGLGRSFGRPDAGRFVASSLY